MEEVEEAFLPPGPALAPLELADWRSFRHGPALIYLLAHARREAFYIDIAENREAIQKEWHRIAMLQMATLPEARLMPPLLVWFEPADEMSSAQARLKQIRDLPHAWQRRLVDMMNPAWLDLDAYFHGFPLDIMPVVGERHTLCRDLRLPAAE